MSSIQLFTQTDAPYPSLLRNAQNAPEKIYVLGQAACLNEPSIAIVGSRKASDYGLQVSRMLSRALAQAGITTVSGLARGIDTAVHRATLDAGGQTIAVMGTGPDTIYPSENSGLAKEICQKGALVTEFDPGTRAYPGNFPMRNRIIAGLSLGTVVVEAALKSGALITARLATEGGKDVFAVPGSITSTHSEGSNRLISQGAKLISNVDDIFEEIEILRSRIQKPRDSKNENPKVPLTGDEQDLLNLISFEPISIDTLLKRYSGGAGRVANSLLSLELKGVILTLPGKRYART